MMPAKRVSIGSYLVLLLGVSLFFVAVSVIFYSEFRSSRRAVTLDEVAHLVQDASAAQAVLSENEGGYVFVNGEISSREILRDRDFSLDAKALSLHRAVEVFQSVEREEQVTGAERERRLKLGLPTTATVYYSQWVHAPVEQQSSTSVKAADGEGDRLLYPSYTHYADRVMLGAYQLSPSILKQLDLPQVLVDHTKLTIPSKLASHTRVDEDYLYIRASALSEQERATAVLPPQLGDQRIRWYVTLPGAPLSIIAQQAGRGLMALSSSSEKDVIIAHQGLTSLPALLEYSADRESYEKRTLRLGVVILLWISFCLITGRMVHISADSFFWVGLVDRFKLISSFLLTLLTLFPIIAAAIMRSEPQRGFVLLLVSLFCSIMFYLLCTSRGRTVLRDRAMQSARFAGGVRRF